MSEEKWQADEIFINNAPSRAMVRIDEWGGATVADCGVSNAETMRRAKLMAAAPRMLSALRAIYRECALMHKHWGDGYNQKEADKAVMEGLEIIGEFEE